MNLRILPIRSEQVLDIGYFVYRPRRDWKSFMPTFRFEFAGNSIHLKNFRHPRTTAERKFSLLANEVELIRNAENPLASATLLACLPVKTVYNIHNYYNNRRFAKLSLRAEPLFITGSNFHQTFLFLTYRE
jgi:hypothetical protein